MGAFEAGYARHVLTCTAIHYRGCACGCPAAAMRIAGPPGRVGYWGSTVSQGGHSYADFQIGLGTWQFGSGEWGYGKSYAEQESQAIVRRAIELGVTLFDTAEISGFGADERILGQAISGHRDQVFLATKILPVMPIPPVVQQRAVASADRLGVSRPRPVPGAPAESVRRGLGHHARHAAAAADRPGRRGSRQQLLLYRWKAAEDALGSRVLGSQVRYSLVAPGRRTTSSVRGAQRARGDRLQPAGAGVPVRPVRRVARPRTGSGRTARCSCR